MRKAARLWPLLLTSALGIAFLCGLGTWQLQRLAQKTALVATLESRMSEAAVPLDVVIAKISSGEDVEYTKVTLSGVADGARALRKITSFDGNPGWEILAPFKTEAGPSVLVDFGTVIENQPFTLPPTLQTFDGVIRTHNKGRGMFDGDNDVANNVWYWWDIPAMQTAANAPDAPAFIVQKLPVDGDASPPFAQKPKVELSNNHLGYAITWFGLAAALAAVTAAFARTLVKKTDA